MLQEHFDLFINFGQAASDATQIFEETKHSVEAREMMHAFFVGIFVEVSRINVTLTFFQYYLLPISVFPNECNMAKENNLLECVAFLCHHTLFRHPSRTYMYRDGIQFAEVFVSERFS